MLLFKVTYVAASATERRDLFELLLFQKRKPQCVHTPPDKTAFVGCYNPKASERVNRLFTKVFKRLLPRNV